MATLIPICSGFFRLLHGGFTRAVLGQQLVSQKIKSSFMYLFYNVDPLSQCILATSDYRSQQIKKQIEMLFHLCHMNRG